MELWSSLLNGAVYGAMEHFIGVGVLFMQFIDTPPSSETWELQTLLQIRQFAQLRSTTVCHFLTVSDCKVDAD
jgi:hypothetical protein